LTTLTANPGITVHPTDNSATVNIADDDAATVSIARISDGAETSTDAKLQVTQSFVSCANTVVNYSIGGSASAPADYATLSGSLTILTVQTTANIDMDVTDIHPLSLHDALPISLTTLTANPGITVHPTDSSATVNIADDDAATVSIARI